MAKFYGTIGYGVTEETRPGVWTNKIIERTATGDVIRNTSHRTESSDSTNDNLKFNNQFSIIADPYVLSHYSSIKYVEFMGAKWKVTSVEPRFPRLILSVGGVYNGEQT